MWFLLPTYPIFFNPTLNIKMVFGEKIPKMGTFSDFVNIFFVKAAQSVTFDILILKIMFLFFKNTVKKNQIQVNILPFP